MQVVTPIDIEDALRIDLSAELSGYRIMAQPVPVDLKSGDVVIYATGGGRMSAALTEYDVSIDCYASNEVEACDIARIVGGVLASLPLRNTSTQYNAASANPPYMNFDQRAPQLARYTLVGRVTCPGVRIDF